MKSYFFAQPAPVTTLTDARPDRIVSLSGIQHMLRDGAANLFLQSLVCETGYNYEGLLFNFPPQLFRRLPPAFSAYPDSSGDLIVQTTRPPLNDAPGKRIKFPDRSGSLFEFFIAENVKRFFKHCSREMVILSEEADKILCSNWPSGDGKRRFRKTTFSLYRNAFIKNRVNPVGDILVLEDPEDKYKKFTIGYLVFVPSLYQGPKGPGPGFLLAFGMDGNATQTWCLLLNAHPEYRNMINRIIKNDKPCLVMGLFSLEQDSVLKNPARGPGSILEMPAKTVAPPLLADEELVKLELDSRPLEFSEWVKEPYKKYVKEFFSKEILEGEVMKGLKNRLNKNGRPAILKDLKEKMEEYKNFAEEYVDYLYRESFIQDSDVAEMKNSINRL